MLAALVLVTAILGGTIVYAQASKVTTTYRTALVTYGTITQSIGMAGNLTPVNEADLNFASAGTVQNLYVQVGQTVAAGTALATLDTSLLSAQLQQAQATLDSANAKLSQDRAGPTTQSLTSAENSVGSAQVSMNNAQTSLADTQAINAQAVAVAQAPVTVAQNALTAEQAVQQPTINADNAKLATDQATLAADCLLNATSTLCTTTDPVLVATDKTNLATDNQPIVDDQLTLTSAQSALTAATAKAQQSNDQAAAQLASMQQQYSAAKASLYALQTSTSPQTVEMDDAQIQIDQVNVNSMQNQVNGATLTSPIPGIVSQMNIKAGQSVTSGGTTSAIVIFSPGSYDLTGTVSDSQVNLVAVGQSAQVTPAGSTQALLGKITAISPTATVSSGHVHRHGRADQHEQLDQAGDLGVGRYCDQPGRARAHGPDERGSHHRRGIDSDSARQRPAQVGRCSDGRLGPHAHPDHLRPPDQRGRRHRDRHELRAQRQRGQRARRRWYPRNRWRRWIPRPGWRLTGAGLRRAHPSRIDH